MEEANQMEVSIIDGDAEDECRRARRSSLKVPKFNQDTTTNLKRRVSFASSSTIKPFAADSEKLTIWDTSYEEEMNTNDSSKLSNDKSIEVDEINTRKLKLPKDKEEFLMDKENFNIHKSDEIPNTSSNQVQIYEDSTCNSDMNITVGAQLVQIECNQTKLGTEKIEFSLGLLENVGASNKMSNTQPIDQSMELTSNLPVANILCRKVLSLDMKSFLDITTESSVGLERTQLTDQSMQLTENLPVTHLFTTNIKSAQTKGDITGLETDEKPGETNIQQIDESMQLTANLPTNTNVTQNERDMLIVGSTALPDQAIDDAPHVDQSMQLTANLPVINLFNSTTNCTQKDKATTLKPDLMEFTFGLSEDLDKTWVSTSIKIFNESMEITSDLPSVPAVRKFPSNTSKLYSEISSTMDTTSDLLKSVDSSKKGFTNLDDEGVIKGLHSMLLSREASLVSDVTKLRNTTRIFHGLDECVPSITDFGKKIRQTSKHVMKDQIQSISSGVNIQKLAEIDRNKDSLADNETVEGLPSSLPLNKSEHVESRLSEVAGNVTEPSYSNKVASEGILNVEIKHHEVKQVDSFKLIDFSNDNLEAILDPDLSSGSLQGSPNLTECCEKVEAGVEEPTHTKFGGHNGVKSINPGMGQRTQVDQWREEMIKLLDEMANIKQKKAENDTIRVHFKQRAIKCHERDNMVRNMLENAKRYLRKPVGNKELQEEFEKVMNANKVPDNDGESSGSTTTKNLEEKVSELFQSSQKSWRFCGTSKNKQQYYFTAIYETVAFEVHIGPNSPTVCDVKSYQNLKENAPTMCKYNARVLKSYLSMENLLSTLGNNFDLLTLLDYVRMVMENIFVFHEHFLLMRKDHCLLKLSIDPDFSVRFELVNVNSLIWWVFTLKLSTTTIGHYDHLRIHSLSIEKVNTKDIEHMAEEIPKRPEFLKNFIDSAINYVNNYSHTYTNE